MKNKLILGLLALTALLPSVASAHERQMFTLGDKEYLFVIGSLNEPIAVGDKTGVDLRVLVPDPADKYNASSLKAVPVAGLEKDLTVEISAGGEKLELPLKGVYGKLGSYSAYFYPSAPTTYTYRIFGTVNNVDVNLSFACNAGGEAAAADETKLAISDGVERTYKIGSFGCPVSRDEITFPAEKSGKTSPMPIVTYVALFAGLLGSVLGVKNIRS